LTATGKIVGQHRYFHTQLLPHLSNDDRDRVESAIRIAQVSPNEHFNVVKLVTDKAQVSLLDYTDFFEEAFPVLRRFWTVDLDQSTCRHRNYEESTNPPILHRKELLLPLDHPNQGAYKELTLAAEQIGLFDDPIRIGFRRPWEALLAQKGYRAIGHQLIPIGNDEAPDETTTPDEFAGVARHLTALTRYGFSAPLQTLARFGFLDGSRTVFDYGCGRGDDLRGLLENNVRAGGWDPHFAPDSAKHGAQLVNLGFVINVIENLEERVEALHGAYALADELLVVSAMLANQNAVKGIPYGDGVLTSRNTFQKYYTQGELRQFIAETLHEEPIPVGPGIFYVFKDKDAEQCFMYGRLENRRNILRLTRLSRPPKPGRPDKAQVKYEEHRDLLESLWETCLILGRDPDRGELNDLAGIAAAFGSLPAALRFIKSRKENAEAILETAHASRIDDLRVYFAQLQFEKRKPYRHLEERLQRDIRTFFGDYNTAVADGRQLLFSLANIEAIRQACHTAAEHGIGWLTDSESLQLHTSLVEQLPAILRAYIRSGTVLYGDVSSADLIKIHIRSGKLTLMTFDDFIGKPLPRMTQRIKINLRKQDLDVFDYTGPYTPPYLYQKSRFINEEFPYYAEQVAFEESLDALNLPDFSCYGPDPDTFDELLEKRRYQVDGFQLIRSNSIPDLDAPCGQYLKYRDLIECGETQAVKRIPNLPQQADSYTALLDLAVNVLDPVIDYFGMIQLTYGFASPDLTKHIKGRIAPKLDQHAAHEVNRLGKPICDRLGAAVDYYIEDENMIEVGKWIAVNIPFDRLYIYGPELPIHISYGPEMTSQITLMAPSKVPDRLVPKTISIENFLKLIS
jgi:DNA phosphorothioation-associated putative methyltransferase